jgi:NADH-quinone oxidoreductase subunit J
MTYAAAHAASNFAASNFAASNFAAAGNTTSGLEASAFWILGPIAVIAALGMVFSKRAVHGALLLAVDMLCLAVLYAAQDAPFLAFVQVIVYTGAVMMLFLFVLMLVGVDASDSLIETLRGQRVAGGVAALGFAVLLCAGLGQAAVGGGVGLQHANAGGNPQGLAELLFTRYVFAFEVTSALLITAALGAMVLAHRERTTAKPTQRDLMRRRFASGAYPGPLPPPGVYARHNAVDTPALLPDGTPAMESVSPLLEPRRTPVETAQLGELEEGGER